VIYRATTTRTHFLAIRRQNVTGLDEPLCDATINFFEAIVAYLENNKDRAIVCYRTCQAEMAKSPDLKFCLLQVAFALAQELAMFVGERMLDPDRRIKAAEKSATSGYYRYLIATVILFTVVSGLIFTTGLATGYQHLAFAFVAAVTAFSLFRHKRNAEKNSLGLIHSSAIEWGNAMVGLLCALVLTSLGELFQDFHVLNQ
jgi:hypothetical protein